MQSETKKKSESVSISSIASPLVCISRIRRAQQITNEGIVPNKRNTRISGGMVAKKLFLAHRVVAKVPVSANDEQTSDTD